MKKSLVIALTSMNLLLGTGGKALASGLPVYDGARALDFIHQFARMKEQLDTAKAELSQAQQLYQSVTGNRGFGDTLRNQQLREFLPQNMKNVYDTANGSGYRDISGSLKDLARQEELTGSVGDMERSIEERSRNASLTDKALGLRAYEGAQQRLTEIESLMDEIRKTQDPKAISELQARISGEQTAIQNETTKLQMIIHLRAIEQSLIEEQKKALSAKILSSKNKEMPKIR